MTHRGRLRDKLKALEIKNVELQQAVTRALARDTQIDAKYMATIRDLRTQLDALQRKMPIALEEQMRNEWWALRPRFLMLRPEETIRVTVSPDKSQANVERLWNGKPVYQLAGALSRIDVLFYNVLPRSPFRDEKGIEP
jgi:hypothetical protein